MEKVRVLILSNKQEWIPSVSATTGDRYPARAIFQIFIALTSGPRFALVFLWYLLTHNKFLLWVGLLRTVSCGGWVYITSTDDHATHDIAMVFYVISTLPWMLSVLYVDSQHSLALKRRRVLTLLFFGTLIPMIYFFIQHKVHHVPGGKKIKITKMRSIHLLLQPILCMHFLNGH